MSKKLPFNVSSYTARLIGRENVSTLDGAILELVKNTYDADASICILYYNEEKKDLYIMDNGTGMTENIIQNHWMTIGNSSKKDNYFSENGRVQTGAKGIGRFALDRVSNRSAMYTKTKSNKTTLEWKVNWEDFESKKNITEVKATLSELKENNLRKLLKLDNTNINLLLEEHFDSSGTVFKMEDLHDTYDSTLIDKLKKSLSSLLIPDFEKEFAIYFFRNNEESIKDAKIVSPNVDSYDYKIKFNVLKNNHVNINIYRNEFDFKSEFDKIIKEEKFTEEDKNYFLGEPKKINVPLVELLNYEIDGLEDTNGSLYFNKITMSKDDAAKFFYKDLTGRANYAKLFGGIKLYRDNFRVRPYGEADSSGYDWLLLGQRNNGSAAISHPNNPWKVAPSQITGIVKISRTNILLEDQANREGLVETKQFRALKDLIISIITLFEEDRQYVGRKLIKRYDRINPEEEARKNIEKKAKAIEKGDNPEDNMVNASEAKMVINKREEQIQNLEEENRMLRNLATTGILANQYIHETKESANAIGLNLTTIDVSLEENDIKEAKKYIAKCDESIRKLNSWFEVTLKSIRRDKRKMKYVNISSLLTEQINDWNRVLKNQDVMINLNTKNVKKEFKCFPYEIESIISNLIANSMYEFKGMNEKNININVEDTNEGILIQYFDNGNGLAPGYKKNPEKILEPFETNKRNSMNEKIGTGMGMWIIKNIVNDYDGMIDLSKNETLKKGFIIIIELKSKRRNENV